MNQRYCGPLQAWQGSSQPREAVYTSVPKPVPACSSKQLWCRHRSSRLSYHQSKFDSQVQRKDSFTNAVAPEPGDAYYAQEDEEKLLLYSLAPIIAQAYYNVQSPQDNAVKAWSIDPYILLSTFYVMYLLVEPPRIHLFQSYDIVLSPE